MEANNRPQDSGEDGQPAEKTMGFKERAQLTALCATASLRGGSETLPVIAVTVLFVAYCYLTDPKHVSWRTSTPFIWVAIMNVEVASAICLVATLVPKPKPTTLYLIAKDGKNRRAVSHGLSAWGSTLEKFTGILSLMCLKVISGNMEIEYIGPVDANQPSPKPFMQIYNTKLLRDSIEKTNWRNVAMYVAPALILISLMNFMAGLLITCAVVSIWITSGDDGDNVRRVVIAKNNSKVALSDGMYHIKQSILGSLRHRGVAYVCKGTLYTRYHVTLAEPLLINNELIKPCYMNEDTDNVAYGASPNYAAPKDGEEVTVALGGPHSRAIVYYRARVFVSEKGYLMFKGLRSIPGCSGSPVFITEKMMVSDDTGVERACKISKFIGCIGDTIAYDPDSPLGEASDKCGVEIVSAEQGSLHTNYYPIVPGKVTQIFKHPGAGKTRTIIPGLINDALMENRKVYITGPTRIVCRAIYEAIQDQYPNMASLMISGSTPIERVGHSIIIAAHATMLNLTTTGRINARGRGVFIMDEAHFNDVKTMCLKDYLRHSVERGKGSLIEMTATGYNFRTKAHVMMDNSNYHIDDIQMSQESMIIDMIERAKTHKVVTFVPSTTGPNITSAESIRHMALKAGVAPIILSRKTFNDRYAKARDREKGLILTTDISECGANFNTDYVYDFQTTLKMIRSGDRVSLQNRVIDEGQRIQRRGRVGRRKKGIYISPSNQILPVQDGDRVEHYDRQVFAQALNIDIKDPVYHAATVKLTPEQAIVWMAGDLEIQSSSPHRVLMETLENGHAKNEDQLKASISEWYTEEGEVDVDLGNDVVATVRFWDERDKDTLLKYLAAVGVQVPNVTEPKLRSYVNKLTVSAGYLLRKYHYYGPNDTPGDEEGTVANTNTNVGDDAAELAYAEEIARMKLYYDRKEAELSALARNR